MTDRKEVERKAGLLANVVVVEYEQCVSLDYRCVLIGPRKVTVYLYRITVKA